MTCRKMRILLAVGGWLLAWGWSPVLAAEGPTRLPSVLRIRADGPAKAPAAAEPPSAAQEEGRGVRGEGRGARGEGQWVRDHAEAIGANSSIINHQSSIQVSQASYLLQSEETPAVEGLAGPVPVETVVAYALANNPEIQATRYRARSIAARVPQAASLPDPELMTTTFLRAMETVDGPQEFMLSVSQRFPWFGKLPLRSQVAYHDAMAAYAEAMTAELKVVEQVKRAYYEIYYLQRAVEVIRALQPRIKDVVEITKTKYENSQAGLESVYQAQTELSNLSIRLVELEQDKREAQARLAALLHLPPQARIDAAARFDRTRVTHTARLLVDLAESYTPELDARRREISRDRASVALARREYWPDLTVGFDWIQIGSKGMSPMATGEDSYSLDMGINLPLYRRRLDAAVREAQYNSARSARQYAAALDEVRREVVELYAQFSKHHQVLEILSAEIVPRAEQTLDLSITAYDVGKLPFEQLIRNYRDLLDYRIDLHKREALREQAIASLERAVGCAVTAWPPPPGGYPADDSQPPEAPLPPPAQ
jgi:cobalt-zinc-cadmium efflux system outer membrane protein